ncbi:MAG: hypothetical protein AAF899_11110 [Pseudomonadota bacterium]
MSAPPLPVIDAGYLHRLDRHLGRQTVEELIADALLELADRRSRLATALDAVDAGERCYGIAHDLKALAGSVGLTALMAASDRVQRLAGGDDPAGEAGALRAAVDQLLARIDDALLALSSRRLTDSDDHIRRATAEQRHDR